jgi:hypothetical protein
MSMLFQILTGGGVGSIVGSAPSALPPRTLIISMLVSSNFAKMSFVVFKFRVFIILFIKV